VCAAIVVAALQVSIALVPTKPADADVKVCRPLATSITPSNGVGTYENTLATEASLVADAESIVAPVLTDVIKADSVMLVFDACAPNDATENAIEGIAHDAPFKLVVPSTLATS